MRTRWKTFLLPCILLTAPVGAFSDVKQQIQERSERTVIDQSISAEQARAKAQSRSEYGLELRPFVTDSDAGFALRIYLPDQWNKSRLREQLALVAESEQLRVAALEWRELMQAYRLFCDYRMVKKQLVIYGNEIEFVEPYLAKADTAVEQNHLSVADRARLYSFYLDLINDREVLKADLLETEQELRLLLGAEANLAEMAETAVVGMPAESEFNALLNSALNNRTDYRQFDVQTRSLTAAEALAKSEDGFRLKYIQPAYEMDYNNGESSYGISASFVLPWGTRNPDIAVYQQQRMLALSTMDLQRSIIEHRLRVLLKSAEAYYEQAVDRSEKIKPLLTRLALDMETMNTGRLEELRDQLLVRERILDVSLQTAKAISRKEKIAVDLAEELGTLTP